MTTLQNIEIIREGLDNQYDYNYFSTMCREVVEDQLLNDLIKEKLL